MENPEVVISNFPYRRIKLLCIRELKAYPASVEFTCSDWL